MSPKVASKRKNTLKYISLEIWQMLGKVLMFACLEDKQFEHGGQIIDAMSVAASYSSAFAAQKYIDSFSTH